jgi:hypothetical protein
MGDERELQDMITHSPYEYIKFRNPNRKSKNLTDLMPKNLVPDALENSATKKQELLNLKQ